ncbi:Trigger factor [Gossypium arboreum]|uniref:Trigger factor n=1 Tax=Gossypium arboreum TaxID=29729 RepID=A0A0B0NRH6_GOSAR|nr:Trigger factor [Gossypium arboreum]
MYRKEQCLSLLDDFEQNEVENEDNDDVGPARQLNWHKKRKSVLQMQQKKIYDEECLKIDNSEKYTLNKQLFESISKSLNEAETKEEIDDIDAKC